MRSLRLRSPSRHEVLRRVRPSARGRRPRRGLAAAARDRDVLRHGRVDEPRRFARPRGLPRDPGRLPADVRGGRPALRRVQRAVGGRRAARLLRLPAGARGSGATRGPRRVADRGGDRAVQRAAQRAAAGAGRPAQRARGDGRGGDGRGAAGAGGRRHDAAHRGAPAVARRARDRRRQRRGARARRPALRARAAGRARACGASRARSGSTARCARPASSAGSTWWDRAR